MGFIYVINTPLQGEIWGGHVVVIILLSLSFWQRMRDEGGVDKFREIVSSFKVKNLGGVFFSFFNFFWRI